MANEITVQVNLTVRNGLQETNSYTASIDQDVIGGPTPGTVTIGTTEEEVTFAELAVPGQCILLNLDPANFVEWGTAAGARDMRLHPRVPAVVCLSAGASLFMRSDTAACKVMIKAYET